MLDKFTLLGPGQGRLEKKFCRTARAVSVISMETAQGSRHVACFFLKPLGADLRVTGGPGVSRSTIVTTDRFIKEVRMLVLSRKLNEKIVIAGNITITVVKIDRNQVRLGIEAPGEVPVYREEILPIALKEARDAVALAVCS
jgi:carbon storage regulator